MLHTDFEDDYPEGIEAMNDNTRMIRFRDLPFYEKSVVIAAWIVLLLGVLWFVLTVREALFS